MVINYCFTVYNEPELLRHTILRLQHPNARFFIHVDKRVDEGVFREVLDEFCNVKFIEERVVSMWGDISTVDAILALLKTALADGEEGYCVILSGQDYPIKTPQHIFQYLRESWPKEFIHASAELEWSPELKNIMDSHAKGYWISLSGKIKLVIYPHQYCKISGLPSLRLSQIPSIFRKLFSINTLKVIGQCYFKPRQIPSGINLYASETWFQITTNAARYVLDFLADTPAVYEFYRYFGLPEESMIQSIILSNPIFKNRWHGDFLSLIKRDSSDPVDSLHILPESFDRLRSAIHDNEKILTRKVSYKDKHVIDYIDNLVDGYK